MPIVDEYIQKFSSPQREALEKIRDIVMRLAPDAREALSYNMPAYRLGDQYLVWFAAFKGHVSIFPASDEMAQALGDDLARLRKSKGTIQFPLARPLPDSLIEEIVRYRLQAIRPDSTHQN